MSMEINECIQYLVSAMSPFSNANPIFAVNVVNSSQDFWFYSTKQVSFWMRDDSLWANGAKFDYLRALLVASAAVGTLSFYAPDLCDSRWPMDPIVTQDIDAVDRPCTRLQK